MKITKIHTSLFAICCIVLTSCASDSSDANGGNLAGDYSADINVVDTTGIPSSKNKERPSETSSRDAEIKALIARGEYRSAELLTIREIELNKNNTIPLRELLFQVYMNQESGIPIIAKPIDFSVEINAEDLQQAGQILDKAKRTLNGLEDAIIRTEGQVDNELLSRIKNYHSELGKQYLLLEKLIAGFSQIRMSHAMMCRIFAKNILSKNDREKVVEGLRYLRDPISLADWMRPETNSALLNEVRLLLNLVSPEEKDGILRSAGYDSTGF